MPFFSSVAARIHLSCGRRSDYYTSRRKPGESSLQRPRNAGPERVVGMDQWKFGTVPGTQAKACFRSRLELPGPRTRQAKNVLCVQCCAGTEQPKKCAGEPLTSPESESATKTLMLQNQICRRGSVERRRDLGGRPCSRIKTNTAFTVSNTSHSWCVRRHGGYIFGQNSTANADDPNTGKRISQPIGVISMQGREMFQGRRA